MQAYYTTYGLPVLIARCCNQFGAHQYPEKLIPRMIACALAHQRLPVYGDGMQVREWMAVEDGCQALLALLERGIPGEVYNVGSGCERTNIWMVERIVDHLHQMLDAEIDRSLITHVQDRRGHDRRYAMDTAKLAALHWWPRVQEENFGSALQEVVQWYATHPETLLTSSVRGSDATEDGA